MTFNAADIQRAEIPGANGMGTADSLARMYGACVGEVSGVRLMSSAQVEDALVLRSAGRQVFGPPDRGERWGTGFSLDCAPMRLLGPHSSGTAAPEGKWLLPTRRRGRIRLHQQPNGRHRGSAR